MQVSHLLLHLAHTSVVEAFPVNAEVMSEASSGSRVSRVVSTVPAGHSAGVTHVFVLKSKAVSVASFTHFLHVGGVADKSSSERTGHFAAHLYVVVPLLEVSEFRILKLASQARHLKFPSPVHPTVESHDLSHFLQIPADVLNSQVLQVTSAAVSTQAPSEGLTNLLVSAHLVQVVAEPLHSLHTVRSHSSQFPVSESE